jgi:probable HAF family extracellular repeat protein
MDLGTLGGTWSAGNAINSSDQVTGYSRTTPGSFVAHAFLYSGGTMTDLGTLGGSYSYGYGINASGQVVGSSYLAGDTTQHGFLYTGGTMVDLNTLVDSLVATNIQIGGSGGDNGGTNAINDWGQIAVAGTVGGRYHALLLTPATPISSVSTVGGVTTRDTKLVSGSSYASIAPTVDAGGSGTTVSLLGGTAGANNNVTITFTPAGSFATASSIVNLSGTGSDTFVLQLTYDEAAAISLFGSEAAAYLAWRDPFDNTWKNAVFGNTGVSTPLAVSGAYNASSDFHLGTYGVDTVNNTVWAVINHNSDFGVAPVPEPSVWLLLGGGLGGLAICRFKRGDRI